MEESLIERTHFAHIIHLEPGVVRFLLCDSMKLQRLGQKVQKRPQVLFLIRHPSPPSVYLGRHSSVGTTHG